MKRLVCILLFCFADAHAQSVWHSEGPAPNTAGQVENIANGEVSGAIQTVAAHPSNPSIVYIGAVNGGIWRTDDATNPSGPTWVEQLGADRSLSIGAIAFDPLDPSHLRLAAGSGRFSQFTRSLGGKRSGILRTTDGMTWQPIDGGGRVSGLNVCGIAPRDQTIVIATDATETAELPGLWRTIDAGVTWTRISGAVGSGLPDGRTFELASDPSSPSRLYTNGGAEGIFRSTDTGATWDKVSTAQMDALMRRATNLRIAVGGTGEVYVAFATAHLIGLFRSPNGIDHWTALDLPSTRENGVVVGIHAGGQGGTNLSLAADPSNANVVYIGGDRQPELCDCRTQSCSCFPNSLGANDYSGRLFRVDASKPRTTQATSLTHMQTASRSAPHGDSRDMTIDAGGDLIEVDDGGIYRRTAPLTNGGDWLSLNGDVSVAELHSIAWDANAHVIIGGAQDTGTPEQIARGSTRWRSVSTSDGGDVCVDSTSTPGRSFRYSSVFELRNFRRQQFDAANHLLNDDLLQHVVTLGRPIAGSFVTPVAVNQADPTRLVIGAANGVYESFDQGDTVEQIGPNFVVNAEDAEPLAYGSAGNPDVLYFGAGSRLFIRTVDGGQILPIASYHGGQIVDIALDRTDPNVVFVADQTSVYQAEGNWSEITGNLQTLEPGTLLSIAFSTSNAGGSIIVGGNNGVFVSRGPAFGTWSRLGSGLPRVPIYDLAYDPSDEILAAATLGRGAWTISLHEVQP